jgi:predicted oxidoreductase
MESLKLGKSNILSSSRIKAAKQALEINYSREDWYRLLEARNGYPVP